MTASAINDIKTRLIPAPLSSIIGQCFCSICVVGRWFHIPTITEAELPGNNRYPDDLNIVSITNINQAKIAIPRFQVGGRWFDDIVNNLKSRKDK